MWREKGGGWAARHGQTYTQSKPRSIWIKHEQVTDTISLEEDGTMGDLGEVSNNGRQR